MKLKEITSGASLEGIEPSTVAKDVAAITISPDTLQIACRLPDGARCDRLLLVAPGSLVEQAPSGRLERV